MTVVSFVLCASAYAAKVSVTRTLPSTASCDSSFTVTLQMDVNESDTPTPNAVGLTEYFPDGWSVSNISSGGVDKGDRIEWLFSLITQPVQDRNITYVVSVPSSSSGAYLFSGSILDVGDTGGDDWMTILPYKISVTRNLPSVAYTSHNITVQLYLDITESKKPNAIGLVEFFPEGWTASNISHGGILRNASIEWLFSSITSPVEDADISYVLSVPSDANGTYAFDGQFNYSAPTGSASQQVSGEYEVDAYDQCALIGDVPPCGVVSIPEVVNVITGWASGAMTLEDVIAMINAWASSM